MSLNRGAPKDETKVESRPPNKQGKAPPAASVDQAAQASNQSKTSQQANQRDDKELKASVEVTLGAEKPMDPAWWGVGVEAVSAVLSFISIGFVFYALLQTNKSLRLAMKDRATATRRAISQSEETARALQHGAESAGAMKSVADTLERQSKIVAETSETNKRIADAQSEYAIKQMRAYLSVVLARATYQDEGTPFGATCTIVNSGSTAAKSVNCVMRADVMPYPPPNASAFPEPILVAERGFIPPHQTREIWRAVNTTFMPNQVPSIRNREGSALVVWGRVDYVDEFDEPRVTNFGISIFWVLNADRHWVPVPEYIPGMNDCT